MTAIPGIGDALAASIIEFAQTGSTAVLDKLRAELPPGALALSQIPGLTLRRIRALYDDLKIKSIEDLEAAAREHKIARVKGFGAKTEELILANLAAHKSDVRRILLLEANAIAARLKDYLVRKSGAEAVFIAGDVRPLDRGNRRNKICRSYRRPAETLENAGKISRYCRYR